MFSMVPMKSSAFSPAVRITFYLVKLVMVTVIDDSQKVACGDDLKSLVPCDVFSLWSVGAQCGCCPLEVFGESYFNAKLECVI